MAKFNDLSTVFRHGPDTVQRVRVIKILHLTDSIFISPFIKKVNRSSMGGFILSPWSHGTDPPFSLASLLHGSMWI